MTPETATPGGGSIPEGSRWGARGARLPAHQARSWAATPGPGRDPRVWALSTLPCKPTAHPRRSERPPHIQATTGSGSCTVFTTGSETQTQTADGRRGARRGHVEAQDQARLF